MPSPAAKKLLSASSSSPKPEGGATRGSTRSVQATEVLEVFDPSPPRSINVSVTTPPIPSIPPPPTIPTVPSSVSINLLSRSAAPTQRAPKSRTVIKRLRKH